MNCKGRMSFRDFIFPVNPYIIRISHKRSVSDRKIPFSDDVVSDMGLNSRIIKGEGEFFGSSAENDFRRLREMHEKGEGMLYVPSQKSVYAYFSELELIGRDIEGVIKYSFTFIESREKKSIKEASGMISDGRHSLWDYSYISGTDIETLIELNPDVKRPDDMIPAGRRIILC